MKPGNRPYNGIYRLFRHGANSDKMDVFCEIRDGCFYRISPFQFHEGAFIWFNYKHRRNWQ